MASKAFLQQAYLAYFGRPADVSGLAFYSDQTEAQVKAAFSASPESQAFFGSMATATQINTIYRNLFNRDAEPAGISYWSKEIGSGRLSLADAAMGILAGAQNDDKTAVANKLVASEAFTAALDTTAEILGYAGAAAVTPARAFLAGVDSTAASLTAATTGVAASVVSVTTAGSNVAGQTFTLTAGVDPFTGTASNDTFNATETAAAGRTLGGLDVINGGAGNDILNVANTQAAASFTFGGASISGVETINVSTNGDFTGLNVSAISGLTAFNGTAADAAATTLTAAATQDVTLNLGTTNNSTVTGGKVVSVAKATAAAGTLGVTGPALTAVTITKGAGAVTVNNESAAAVANTGTTLTTVTLNAVNADANIGGAALTTLNLTGATAATRTTTVTNATASHGFTINATGAGIDSASLTSAFLAGGAVVTDAVATSLVINSVTTKNSLNVAGFAAATKVTITGDAALTLAAAPAAAVKNIDASAATGALTLGALNAAVVTLSGGAGKDTATLTATTKATVAMGAGDDTLTLGSAVAAGSSINLGAGDDKVLVNAGSVAASTATAVTTIDAGDGTDTVAASLINVANAGQFKNFEALDLSASANLDAELMTGSTISALTLSGRVPFAGPYAATLSNVAAGVGLNVVGMNDDTGLGNGTGVTTIGVKNAATGTADAFTVTFAGAAAAAAPVAANVSAGEVVLNGVESVSIVSAGAANTWNSIALTDGNLKTMTITGDKNLNLTFLGVNGANGATAGSGGAVNSIDGSAATGRLNINTTNVTADDKAGVGLTVKGGSAVDTITLNQKATVDAGAGNDGITVAAAGGTLTGGAGNDTFNVEAAVATAATTAGAVLTTITDLAAGDRIDFAATSTGAFNATKVTLGAGVTNLDLAMAAAVGAVNTTQWFQYAGTTYVISNDADVAFDAGDTVVKITGLVDLANSTMAATVLTIV